MTSRKKRPPNNSVNLPTGSVNAPKKSVKASKRSRRASKRSIGVPTKPVNPPKESVKTSKKSKGASKRSRRAPRKSRGASYKSVSAPTDSVGKPSKMLSKQATEEWASKEFRTRKTTWKLTSSLTDSSGFPRIQKVAGDDKKFLNWTSQLIWLNKDFEFQLDFEMTTARIPPGLVHNLEVNLDLRLPNRKDSVFNLSFTTAGNSNEVISRRIERFQLDKREFKGGFNYELTASLTVRPGGPNMGNFTICCDGRLYNVHKWVMANRCPYFRDLFKDDSHSISFEKRIDHVPADVLDRILEYIYTNKLHMEDLDFDSMVILARKAHYFSMATLVSMCAKRIKTLTKPERVFETLCLAKEISSESLTGYALGLARQIGKVVLRAEDLSRLIAERPEVVGEVVETMADLIEIRNQFET